MRLMLVWAMATRVPSAMVRTAIAARTARQSSMAGAKAAANRRSMRAKATALEATAR